MGKKIPDKYPDNNSTGLKMSKTFQNTKHSLKKRCLLKQLFTGRPSTCPSKLSCAKIPWIKIAHNIYTLYNYIQFRSVQNISEDSDLLFGNLFSKFWGSNAKPSCQLDRLVPSPLTPVAQHLEFLG